jgi:hypothetical protein
MDIYAFTYIQSLTKIDFTACINALYICQRQEVPRDGAMAHMKSVYKHYTFMVHMQNIHTSMHSSKIITLNIAKIFHATVHLDIRFP